MRREQQCIAFTENSPFPVICRDPKHRAAVEKMLQSEDPKFFSFLSKVASLLKINKVIKLF